LRNANLCFKFSQVVVLILPMNEKSIFRRLPVPDGAGLPGSAQVFLSERPGGRGAIADQFAKIKTIGISKVWCLLTDSEWELAASYREAVAEGLLVAEHHRLPLRASCLANDKLRLEESLKLMVAALKSGESVLIHCEAGQVRTGCAAGALLMMLGLGLEDALAEVRAAGSDPEPFSPSDLLRAFVVE
jgi:hypothetical protein